MIVWVIGCIVKCIVVFDDLKNDFGYIMEVGEVIIDNVCY